jgi:hypothetical protein
MFVEDTEVLMLVDGIKRQKTPNLDCLIHQQFEQQAAVYNWLCCYQIFCSEASLWFAILLFADIYLY